MRLDQCPAAVNCQLLPGDKSALVAGKERHRSANFIGQAHAVKRYGVKVVTQASRRCTVLKPVTLRRDPSRSNKVHGNTE